MTHYLLVEIKENYGEENAKAVMDSIAMLNPVKSVVHSYNDISVEHKKEIDSAKRSMLNANSKLLEAQQNNAKAMSVLEDLVYREE